MIQFYVLKCNYKRICKNGNSYIQILDCRVSTICCSAPFSQKILSVFLHHRWRYRRMWESQRTYNRWPPRGLLHTQWGTRVRQRPRERMVPLYRRGGDSNGAHVYEHGPDRMQCSGLGVAGWFTPHCWRGDCSQGSLFPNSWFLLCSRCHYKSEELWSLYGVPPG